MFIKQINRAVICVAHKRLQINVVVKCFLEAQMRKMRLRPEQRKEKRARVEKRERRQEMKVKGAGATWVRLLPGAKGMEAPGCQKFSHCCGSNQETTPIFFS